MTQLNPLPTHEALDALYSADYFSSDGGTGYGDYMGQAEEYGATFKEDVRRIVQFVPKGGTLLDMGCGYGFFLEAALEAGFDAYGVDISEKAVQVAGKRFPGRVFPYSADSPPEQLAGKEFDVIFASHLIEHIAEPLPFLEKIGARLASNGILVLVTPNIGSLLARFSGARWVSFKVPEHVAYYNPKTIRKLLSKAGMETLAIDSAYQHYRVPFVAEKIRNLFHPFSRIIPKIETSSLLKNRIIRVTSGSLRAIAMRR